MRSLPNIDSLKDLYPGGTLHVIGSGPSLAQLSPDQVGEGPVVAINYAIRTVETMGLPNPVYSMQKDQAFTLCDAPVLAHLVESARNDDFGEFVFDCVGDFGIPYNAPSVVVALHFARWFGCEKAVYHCCDSFCGDFRSYDGYSVTQDNRAIQYVHHRGMVEREAERMGMEWGMQCAS